MLIFCIFTQVVKSTDFFDEDCDLHSGCSTEELHEFRQVTALLSLSSLACRRRAAMAPSVAAAGLSGK